MQFILEHGKIVLRTFYGPVRQSVGCEGDALLCKEPRLAVQRYMGNKLIAEDKGEERGGDAVSEDVNRLGSLDDSTVIGLGSINMDMMFIHNKCFRYHGKALIDDFRQLLIAFWITSSQFLL